MRAPTLNATPELTQAMSLEELVANGWVYVGARRITKSGGRFLIWLPGDRATLWEALRHKPIEVLLRPRG